MGGVFLYSAVLLGRERLGCIGVGIGVDDAHVLPMLTFGDVSNHISSLALDMTARLYSFPNREMGT